MCFPFTCGLTIVAERSADCWYRPRAKGKRYPDPSQGLSVLWEKPAGVDGWNGPYVAKAVPKDPWGHDYVLKSSDQMACHSNRQSGR